MISKNDAQQLKIAAVTGAAANTDIAVAGIKKYEDAVLAVYNVTDHTVLTDFTITSDGNIQSPTDTSLKQLLVFWADLSEG